MGGWRGGHGRRDSRFASPRRDHRLFDTGVAIPPRVAIYGSGGVGGGVSASETPKSMGWLHKAGEYELPTPYV